jgi:hypothetical protein
MLHLGEGRLDEAWQDLLACHRLARLIGRGGTLIESLVGVAIEAIACNSTLAYLADPRVTPKQLRACLRDIQALPARSVMADKIDLAERFMYLDAVRLVSRGGLELMEALAGGPPVKALDAKTKAALAKIDWDPALRAGNRWFDRMAESMRHKTRAEREKALDELDDDIKALKAGAAAPENLLKVLQAGGEPDKETGKAIGDVLIVMLVPAVRKVQSADDRAEQINRNLQVAIALALYQREHKAYPQTLKALAPKYLAAIPDDIFSGKAMNYRPAEKGYLLYSVGANGKDEEGRWYDDQPSGDDPRVRMPLPELPRK